MLVSVTLIIVHNHLDCCRSNVYHVIRYVLMPGTTDLVLLCLEKILLSRTCGVDITMLGLLQLLEAWRVVIKPFWVA